MKLLLSSIDFVVKLPAVPAAASGPQAATFPDQGKYNENSRRIYNFGLAWPLRIDCEVRMEHFREHVSSLASVTVWSEVALHMTRQNLRSMHYPAAGARTVV